MTTPAATLRGRFALLLFLFVAFLATTFEFALKARDVVVASSLHDVAAARARAHPTARILLQDDRGLADNGGGDGDGYADAFNSPERTSKGNIGVYGASSKICLRTYRELLEAVAVRHIFCPRNVPVVIKEAPAARDVNEEITFMFC